MHDEEEGIVPQCPAIRPVCNEATHECEPAQSGSILLNRIVITSSGCTDCNTEGADMTLTGRQPDIQCQTVDLDHPGIPDYVSRGDFDADKEGPHENGWGSCHKVSYSLHSFFIIVLLTSQSRKSDKVDNIFLCFTLSLSD